VSLKDVSDVVVVKAAAGAVNMGLDLVLTADGEVAVDVVEVDAVEVDVVTVGGGDEVVVRDDIIGGGRTVYIIPLTEALDVASVIGTVGRLTITDKAVEALKLKPT